MPFPAIANGSVGHKFAFSAPFRRNTTHDLDDKSRVFAGPRTQLSLISTATASLGEILLADLPYNNSAYNITFYAPIVHCEEADSPDTKRMGSFLQEEMAKKWNTKNQTQSAYYSFVPAYDSNGQLMAVSQPREQTPFNATNQLWMTFIRITFNETGDRVKERHYQVCRLHNATYDLTVSQDRGVQNISGSYIIEEVVDFPNDGPDDISDMAQHAFNGMFSAICDELVGRFAWYVEFDESDTTQAAQFGVIDSRIRHTSLLGSRDLDYFFELDEEMQLYKGQNLSTITLSDQRLRDKAFAKNRTLDVLIEELSFNTTVSLMHNTLLT